MSVMGKPDITTSRKSLRSDQLEESRNPRQRVTSAGRFRHRSITPARYLFDCDTAVGGDSAGFEYTSQNVDSR